MTREYDVVIANGIGEEVAGVGSSGKTNDLLRATQVASGLTGLEGSFGSKVAVEESRRLEDGDGTGIDITAHPYPNARLEVRVEFIAMRHIKGNRAMGKQHLTRLRIDLGRVDLESRHTQ